MSSKGNEANKHELAALNSNDHNDIRRERADDLNPPPGRLTFPLFFAVCAAAFGSSFQFGYNLGVVNPIKDVVQNWINETSNDGMSKSQMDLIWSVIVSIYTIGGMVGGLTCGIVADRFGRKGGMLINNAFAFVGAALLGFSKLSGNYYTIMIGRFIIGVNAGLNTGLAPLYLTEISPVNLRGALGTVHQLVCTIAILVAMILGLHPIFGNAQLWPVAFAFTCIPAIYQVIALPFCPESPKYMLINRHQNQRAQAVLVKLRGTEDVQVEMDIMIAEAAATRKADRVSLKDMFTLPELRWPLFIAVMMMMSQQLSGINAAIFYSTEIFKKARLSHNDATYATIGMGAINVLMTVVSTVIVDRFGRRKLHMTGLSGMFVCSILLVIFLTLVEGGHRWSAYVAIIFVVLFVVSFATGPGSIPWFFVSELFLQSSRGYANSVAVVANWLANFVVSMSFLPLSTALGQYSFLFFSVALLIFIAFTFRFVPETKGRTPEEIVAEFRKGKRVAF